MCCGFWRRPLFAVSTLLAGTPRVTWTGMRLWTLASLAPLFAAPIAHAQAPGDVQEDVPPEVAQPAPPPVAPVVVIAPPGMVPMVAAPAPPPEAGCGCEVREPVMANRWAVGFSFGGMSLAPQDAR